MLLIERNPDIGVPVKCAEGTSKRIGQFIRVDKRCICAELISINIFSPDGTRITLYEESKVNRKTYIVRGSIINKETIKGRIKNAKS